MSTVFTITIVISGWIPLTQSNSFVVLNIFKSSIDIFKTGFKIIDFIRKENSGFTEDVKGKLEEVRNDIERMVRSSTTDIIREITLQNKLDRIESIVKELRSLLIDMKNYVLADNENDRENYESLFLERFDQRVVAMIRGLPRLLSYTVPGFSEPLMELIVDKSKCNMTAIHNFQIFYAEILSDGFTLQLVFRELLKVTTTDVKDFWNKSLPRVQKQFDNMEKTCKERLPQYAADEIKQTIDADAMYRNCKERYTWAWCNVLYYPPMGTHQFHYHKFVPDFIFWNGASSSSRNQIMIIGDTEVNVQGWDPVQINRALASNHESFRSDIEWSEDTSAAKKVGNAVEEFVKNKGFQIKAIIVFFDAEGLGNVSDIVDKDSTVAYVSVNDVTLKYCYSSGIACSFASWNLFNFNEDWKEYTGMFHVYVFPCLTTVMSVKCIKHSTSAAINVILDCLVIKLNVITVICTFWIM